MIRSVTDPDNDRDVWLEWRRQGIGASDVAAIAGLSPFATPMTVWLDKTGQLPDEDSDPMRWGRRLETVVADAFHDETGLWIVHPQTQAVDPARPWRRATLDGLTADSPNTDPDLCHGIAELKTTSQPAWDHPPDHVLLQVQWQMAVTGRWDTATVVALHADRGFRLTIHHVDADPGLQDVLGQLVDDFWHNHVLAGVEPAADGLPATGAAIRAAWPDSDPGLIITRDDLTDTWRQLVNVKAEVKAAAERQAELENTLKAAMTDAEILRCGDVTAATWKTAVTHRLDQKALTATHPDIAEQFTRPTTSRRFIVKPAGEGTP